MDDKFEDITESLYLFRNYVKIATQFSLFLVLNKESMEWTNDAVLQFINLYETHPVLWDTTHKFYKIVSKKSGAWLAISEELGIGVAELKKKDDQLACNLQKSAPEAAYSWKKRIRG